MYNTKLIITENNIELYKYSKPIKTGTTEINKHGGGRNGTGDRNRSSTLHKAKTKLLRIINSNTWTMMLTLTYREDVEISQSKKDICSFIKQLRKLYSDYKYLYVIELTKKLRVHFHMLTDIKESIEDVQAYERYLAEIWSHGFIDVQIVNNSDIVGYYLSKYFTKDPIDTSCKLYGYSRNCNKPTEITLLDSNNMMETLKGLGCGESLTLEYTNSYEIEYSKNIVNYFRLKGDAENEV